MIKKLKNKYKLNSDVQIEYACQIKHELLLLEMKFGSYIFIVGEPLTSPLESNTTFIVDYFFSFY